MIQGLECNKVESFIDDRGFLSQILPEGDSYSTHLGISPKLSYDKSIKPCFDEYVGDVDPRQPYLSPIHGDLSGLPPTTIVTGTRDYLLSNCVQLETKLDDAGGTAKLKVYDAMWHGFQEHGFPEGDKALADMSKFFNKYR